jgi:asparagine synthase (glutamine-hydrolysing)
MIVIHRIVSFAFSIPASSKVRGGYTKAIVRDAMRGFFPDEVRLQKKKIGFNTPFTEWLKGPLKLWILDQFETKEFKDSLFINPLTVKHSILNVMNNPAASYADGEEAWKIFMPYVWERSLKFAK